MSVVSDCEEFLGLPRKKDPKIVLDGGDSDPACKWPFIQ